MIQRNHRRTLQRRDAVTVVEVAVTAPVAFLLVIGLIVGALGVFRHQQITHLAREATAYAATHGPAYEKRTGKPRVSASQLMREVIMPMAAGLDASSLACDCTIDEQSNTVSVTMRYQWAPEAFLPGKTMTSTSVMSLRQ